MNGIFESKQALSVKFPLGTHVIWVDDEDGGDGMGDWGGVVTGHHDGSVVVKLDVGGTHTVVPDQLKRL